MNKGFFAILAAAALAASKSRGKGSFGKKRNKSLEDFDKKIKKYIDDLSDIYRQKTGLNKNNEITLFQAYGITQQKKENTELQGIFCPNCPEAYAYSSLMLSMLVHLDGFHLPDERYSEGFPEEFSGNEILEVFAFEATPRGRKYSDSLIWKVEKWFQKCESDLKLINVEEDCSVKDIIDNGMKLFKSLAAPNMSPNYLLGGILSMGITGYVLIQCLRLFVAIPGDKNVSEAMKIIVNQFTEKGQIPAPHNIVNIFSFDNADEPCEIPALFGRDYYITNLIRSKPKSVDILINQGREALDNYLNEHHKDSSNTRRPTKQKAKAMRFARFLEHHIDKIPNVNVDRDRFIQSIFKVNRRIGSSPIWSTATGILDSLMTLKNIDDNVPSFKSCLSFPLSIDSFRVFHRVTRDLQHRLALEWEDVLFAKDENDDLYSEEYNFFIDQYGKPRKHLLWPYSSFFMNKQIHGQSLKLSSKISRSNYIQVALGVSKLPVAGVEYTGNLSAITNNYSGTDEDDIIYELRDGASVFRLMDTRLTQKFYRLQNITEEEHERLHETDEEKWMDLNVDLEDFIDDPPDGFLMINKDGSPIAGYYAAQNALQGIEIVIETLISPQENQFLVLSNVPDAFLSPKNNHIHRGVCSLSRYLLGLEVFAQSIKENKGFGLDRAISNYIQEHTELVRIPILETLDRASTSLVLGVEDRENRRLEGVLKNKIPYTSGSILKTNDVRVVAEIGNSEALSHYNTMRNGATSDAEKEKLKGLKPLNTLVIEYLHPKLLQTVHNLTPGKLCVGSSSDDHEDLFTSYQQALSNGTQRHFGVVVQTGLGFHIIYHTHAERNKWAKSKFTDKSNTDQLHANMSPEEQSLSTGWVLPNTLGEAQGIIKEILKK